LILPVSDYTAAAVKKMRGIDSARVKVLYNAIPNSFAELLMLPPAEEISGVISGKKNGRVLLSVCSLALKNDFKGVDTVIRALPRILKAVPDSKYVVTGDGELRGRLDQLAIETGVRENVSFVGEVSDTELARLYRGCDVFVLPSRGQGRPGVEGGEGFGRVYLEAALAGKPVVGSKSGGAAEAVLRGRTGLLVDPESVDEVAEALLAILQNRELAERMGAAGRHWVLDTFSEEALSTSLRELLRPYGYRNEVTRELAHAGSQP
jgi:phosphatidylinositol alpha-1,6-mannosyltransferase